LEQLIKPEINYSKYQEQILIKMKGIGGLKKGLSIGSKPSFGLKGSLNTSKSALSAKTIPSGPI
jgi:hypothetical protein